LQEILSGAEKDIRAVEEDCSNKGKKKGVQMASW
jgi:hypothetical protein